MKLIVFALLTFISISEPIAAEGLTTEASASINETQLIDNFIYHLDRFNELNREISILEERYLTDEFNEAENESFEEKISLFSNLFLQLREKLAQLTIDVCQDYNDTGRLEACFTELISTIQGYTSESESEAFETLLSGLWHDGNGPYVGHALFLLEVVLEIYQRDWGFYPASIEQLFPNYLQDRESYFSPIGDIEESWRDIRYYPPQTGQGTYTLIPDFPFEGDPNIGRFRLLAEAVLPLIRALEQYHQVNGSYPNHLNLLSPDSGLTISEFYDQGEYYDANGNRWVFFGSDQTFHLYHRLARGIAFGDMNLKGSKTELGMTWEYQRGDFGSTDLELNLE